MQEATCQTTLSSNCSMERMKMVKMVKLETKASRIDRMNCRVFSMLTITMLRVL